MLDQSQIPDALQMPWEKPAASELTLTSLIDLLDDRIPCIVLSDAVSNDDCAKLADACESVGFDYYDDIVPPVGRIGVTQYEYRHRPKLDYYLNAECAEKKHQEIVEQSGVDPDPAP